MNFIEDINKNRTMNINMILMTVVMFSLFSCGKKNIEKNSVTHEDGHVTEGYVIGDSIVEGPSIEYYSTGELFRLFTYRNSRLQGHSLEYYKSGRLKVFGSFENGEKNGKFYNFHENGTLNNISYFLGGTGIGWEASFYPDGRMSKYAFNGYQGYTCYKDSFNAEGVQIPLSRLNNVIDRLSLFDNMKPRVGDTVVNSIMVAQPPYARLIITEGEQQTKGKTVYFKRTTSELARYGEISFMHVFNEPGKKKIGVSALLIFKSGKEIKDSLELEIEVVK